MIQTKIREWFPIQSKWHICLILLAVMVLSGCQLTYPNNHNIKLHTEFSILDHGIDIKTMDLDSLTYTQHDENQIVTFDDDRLLLFKVSAIATEEHHTASEYTLTIHPKYLQEIHHYVANTETPITKKASQFRIQTNSPRFFSSQRFAFNVDDVELNQTHYFLVKSNAPRYVSFNIYNTRQYIRSDAQISHFFTFVYSLIFAMAVFNAVFYFYNREKPYLLYAIYMLFSLYALLWQEGKINDLPMLAIPVLGNHSSLVFIFLTTVTGTWFFYHFMKLNYRDSWVVKLLMVVISLQACLILYSLVNYHFLGNFNYYVIAKYFNLATLASSLLILLIIIIKTIQRQQQARYLLLAWGIMITAVVLRIFFAFDPRPDLIWMPHSYELAVMLEGLILAFAIGNRFMEFKKQRDQAVNKYSKAERSIVKHQLLSQFQNQMQKLAKNSTLSTEEIAEKTNIKFHLLLTQAFPIKNSLVLEGEEVKGICTTGIDVSDIEFLGRKAKEQQSEQKEPVPEQRIIGMSGDKQHNVLFIPLLKKYQDQVTFILNLKNQDKIAPHVLNDLQKFCGQAYNELLQAKEMYQVALAANMDSLTQCYNRSSIETIIQQSLGQKKVTTIAYVDLDNLKHINDQHGHPVGDECIIEFAHLLEHALIPVGKVGRIGGDEFVAVFSGVDFDDCLERLENFMESLENLKISEHKLTITCSVGVAESRMKETTRSLIKKADKALYHSKEQGRNQMTIYETTLS